VTQILKGFRGLLLSRAHSALLAGDCVGRTAAADLFSTLVGDLWDANQARLDLSPIRDGASQCDLYLYGRGPGLPRTFFREEVVDLKGNFYAHRGWFFSLGCGAVVVSVGKEFVLDHRLPNTTNLVFQSIFAATLLIGALTRSERYHKGLIVFVSALFVLYIFVLYARMR
jgi:hypothetical protein